MDFQLVRRQEDLGEPENSGRPRILHPCRAARCCCVMTPVHCGTTELSSLHGHSSRTSGDGESISEKEAIEMARHVSCFRPTSPRILCDTSSSGWHVATSAVFLMLLRQEAPDKAAQPRPLVGGAQSLPRSLPIPGVLLLAKRSG